MRRINHNYLNVMSKEDLDRLSSQLDRINSLMSIARIVMGLVLTCVTGLITVAIWANNTTTALAQTRSDIVAIVSQRTETMKELATWRAQKDENDTKFLQIVTDQQRMLEREQSMLDKINDRLDRIPFVKTP
jgi:hypothetical protein